MKTAAAWHVTCWAPRPWVSVLGKPTAAPGECLLEPTSPPLSVPCPGQWATWGTTPRIHGRPTALVAVGRPALPRTPVPAGPGGLPPAEGLRPALDMAPARNGSGFCGQLHPKALGPHCRNTWEVRDGTQVSGSTWRTQSLLSGKSATWGNEAAWPGLRSTAGKPKAGVAGGQDTSPRPGLFSSRSFRWGDTCADKNTRVPCPTPPPRAGLQGSTARCGRPAPHSHRGPAPGPGKVDARWPPWPSPVLLGS